MSYHIRSKSFSPLSPLIQTLTSFISIWFITKNSRYGDAGAKIIAEIDCFQVSVLFVPGCHDFL